MPVLSLETKEITIKDTYYIIKAMTAIDGMLFLDKIMESSKITPQEMKDIIVKHVSIGGKPMTDKVYDIHFSKKYGEINELFEAIMSFNFEGDSPLDQEEVEDTSEK